MQSHLQIIWAELHFHFHLIWAQNTADCEPDQFQTRAVTPIASHDWYLSSVLAAQHFLKYLKISRLSSLKILVLLSNSLDSLRPSFIEF